MFANGACCVWVLFTIDVVSCGEKVDYCVLSGESFNLVLDSGCESIMVEFALASIMALFIISSILSFNGS